MTRTVKFTISLPAGDFKEIEARRRKEGKTRSQYVRDAVRGAEGKEARRQAGIRQVAAGVKEDSSPYAPKSPELAGLTDVAERRRRAIAAAGRFKSGASDLSSAHDRYLKDGFAPVEGTGPASGSEPGEKP